MRRFSKVHPADLTARIEAHHRFSERKVDFFAWVVDHVPWRGDERVLDVGCGTGAYVPYYRRFTANITVLDIAAPMVAEARKQTASALVADAAALPFPSGAFDVVFANHVLFFLLDPVQAIRECYRVLRQGGWFVATTNAREALARLHALHTAALQRIGRSPGPLRHARFSLEDGFHNVARVFGNARVDVMVNAFRFPDVESAVAYYASGELHNVEGPPLTPEEERAVLTAMRRMIGDIIEAEGAFRVPKPAGVILAQRRDKGDRI